MADETVQPEDSIEIKLTKPINSFGERISVLKMRKPTGADMIRIGNPVDFDPISDPPKITHNMPRVVAMAVRLSGVPSSSFDHMAPQDLSAVAWALTNFFLPTVGT